MRKVFFIAVAMLVGSILTAQSFDEVKNDLYNERYETAKGKLMAITSGANANPDAFYWLGEIYLRQNKIDSAYKTYIDGAGQMLKEPYSKKKSPLVYIGWAHAQLDSGLIPEAKMQMENILKETKYKNADALWAVAKANIDSKNGDSSYAIELLNSAIKRDKKNPLLYNTLGDLYRKQADGSNAVRNYDMALEVDPNNAAAMYSKGKIYKTQKNVDIYLDRFLKAYAMDSTYAPVLYELYQYYFQTDVISAQKYLDKYLANTDPDPGNAYLQADLLYASKKYKDAIDIAEKIKLRDKDTVQPRLHKLIAYSYAALTDSAMALKNMHRYFDTQDTTGYVAKDFAITAKLLEAVGGDTAEIINNYKKALSLETNSEGKVEYLTSLSNIDNAAGNKVQEALWRELLYNEKQSPTNLDIYKWGIALYQGGNFEKADSVFKIYEEKYPDQVYGYLYRAKSNTFLDSTMEKGLAVPSYKKLIEVAGKDEQKNKSILILAYKYLGAYEANITKDYTAALNYFDKLLLLDPQNEEAATNAAVLKKWITEGKDKGLSTK